MPGESQIRRGAGLLLRVGGQRDSRMQRRAWVALGEEVGSWDKGDAGGCPSAFTDCSEKSRDRCSWENFNRRVCEIGKRLAWKCTEPAAEMLFRSSR